MAKNIVVCSDGTSNTRKTDTNVYQFYKLLIENPSNKCFYDKGVGSFAADIFGKAFGTGVGENIRDCYEFIVEQYEPGDRVFLFGFSRGAFTVRSLANFIDLVGLVQRNAKKIHVKNDMGRGRRYRKTHRVHTEKAYKVYEVNKSPSFELALADATEKLKLRRCPIHCIAVWDTVGAIGLPSRSNDRETHLKHRFHQTQLSPRVRYAYQALSLDDERRVFWPDLFRPDPSSAETAPRQKIEEVWFAGMHSDVGGGYPPERARVGKELSDIPLRWMAKKMPRSLGLAPDALPVGKPLGLMHDSREGNAAKIFTRRVRRPPLGAKLHASVVDRIQGPLDQKSYRPPSLKRAKTVAEPTPFTPSWSDGPDFSLEERYEIVDRRYAKPGP